MTSTNWKSDMPLGQWHGVNTNSDGRVTELDLRFPRLSGSIPVAPGSLSELTTLNLFGIGRGDGHDTIADDGFDTASTDRLDFGDGIETDDLWFRRDSDNLVVQVLGTDDRVTLEGWFDAARTPSGRLDEFTASGESLTEANVQKLVDAMATWRTANDATLSDLETMPDDRTLAAALDAAWQPVS